MDLQANPISAGNGGVSCVQHSLASLQNNVAILDKKLKELTNRLVPVTEQAPPGDPVTPVKDRENICPLAEEIDSICDTVCTMHKTVTDQLQFLGI